jgi:hypothetical protein
VDSFGPKGSFLLVPGCGLGTGWWRFGADLVCCDDKE